MNTAAKVGIVGLGVGAWAAGTYYLMRKKQPAVEGEAKTPLDTGERPSPERPPDEAPPSTDDAERPADEIEWTDVLPMPTPDDVEGDLENNWGSTPVDLRPMFMLMEEKSGIVGSGRIFATIARGESGFVPTAHNGGGDKPREKRERAASRLAYDRHKDKRPPLKYGEQAADFGSGGLFGALAPYFLWTGVVEVKRRAPLLNADPRVMFLPRVAGFAACVYLMRLLRHYEIEDHFDIKAGWASPSLLTGDREREAYIRARTRFAGHAEELGIDLFDLATIPQVLDTAAWPGVLELWDLLVGRVPKEKK